jgi:hypothetical protein
LTDRYGLKPGQYIKLIAINNDDEGIFLKPIAPEPEEEQQQQQDSLGEDYCQ